MADNETTTAPAETKNVKTVVDDMASKAFFNNTVDAANYYIRCATEYVDFANYHTVAPGLSQDDAGNLVFDPEIYPDGTRVMIATVSERVSQGNSIIKAIVVCPAPSLDAVIADAAGGAWLAKIFDTAINAAAVRALRKKDVNVTDPAVIEAMPKTLADYVTSSGGATSTLLEGFEKMWRDIKAVLAEMSKAFRLASPSKKEFRRAMESKSYAARTYPMLEEGKRGSIFAFAIDAFTQAGKDAGYDVTIFERWKSTRDETVIDVDADDEEGEFSLDALGAALAKKADAPAEPPAETEAAEAAAE